MHPRLAAACVLLALSSPGHAMDAAALVRCRARLAAVAGDTLRGVPLVRELTIAGKKLGAQHAGLADAWRDTGTRYGELRGELADLQFQLATLKKKKDREPLEKRQAELVTELLKELDLASLPNGFAVMPRFESGVLARLDVTVSTGAGASSVEEHLQAKFPERVTQGIRNLLLIEGMPDHLETLCFDFGGTSRTAGDQYLGLTPVDSRGRPATNSFLPMLPYELAAVYIDAALHDGSPNALALMEKGLEAERIAIGRLAATLEKARSHGGGAPAEPTLRALASRKHPLLRRLVDDVPSLRPALAGQLESKESEVEELLTRLTSSPGDKLLARQITQLEEALQAALKAKDAALVRRMLLHPSPAIQKVIDRARETSDYVLDGYLAVLVRDRVPGATAKLLAGKNNTVKEGAGVAFPAVKALAEGKDLSQKVSDDAYKVLIDEGNGFSHAPQFVSLLAEKREGVVAELERRLAGNPKPRLEQESLWASSLAEIAATKDHPKRTSALGALLRLADGASNDSHVAVQLRANYKSITRLPIPPSLAERLLKYGN